jgi:predicted flap endonuclease-1-like 5' DNA nuclease/cbb3-type cytochrome oxidase subunit 3
LRYYFLHPFASFSGYQRFCNMDKATKSMFSVASLMVGIFLGVNYMVNKEKDGGWLLFALIFLVLALLFWWWMNEPERRAKRDAEAQAREKIRLAEEELRKSRQKFATTVAPVLSETTEPTPAVENAHVAVGTAPVLSEETPAPAVENADVAVGTAPVLSEETPAPAVENANVAVGTAPVLSETTEPVAETPSPVATALAGATDTKKPAKKSSSKKASEGDDLTKLEGIGPYYRDVLHGAGIMTFAKLATLTREEIDDIIKNANARRSLTTMSWAEQATLAAKGDWDGLEALQKTLTGGRK